MAVAVLGSPTSTSGANVLTRTGSYTAPDGSNRLLAMFVTVGIDPAADFGANTQTWAGQNFTLKVDANEVVFCRALIYYMLEAAIAAASGSTWLTTSSNLADLGVCLQCFSGVDQVTPFGTGATGTGIGTSAVADVTSLGGGLVIGNISSDDDTTLTRSGGTEIFQINGIDSDIAAAAGHWPSGSDPTYTQSSNRFAITGIELQAAPGDGVHRHIGGLTSKRLILLQWGSIGGMR